MVTGTEQGMEQNMRGHPLQQSEIDRVVELLRAGMSGLEVAKKAGVNKSSVYRIAERNRIAMDPRTLRDDAIANIVDAVNAGAKRKEIADAHGVSENAIKRIVHGAGVEFAWNVIDWKMKAAETVSSKNPGFEYVDGYENYRSYIRVKCLGCGDVFTTSYDYACSGKLICKSCVERQNKRACVVCGKITGPRKFCCKACEKKYYNAKLRERRESDPEYIKHQAELECKKKQAEEQRLARIEQRRHACPVCGEITLRPKYCSGQCAKRAENKRRETIRRTKIKNAIVDKDITLEGVWQNSLGICYLCGCVCDWDDKQEKDGTIICGDRYPSIDHIVPLSRGGKHSWDNVALACRKCNSVKSDSIPPRGMLTLNGG